MINDEPSAAASAAASATALSNPSRGSPFPEVSISATLDQYLFGRSRMRVVGPAATAGGIAGKIDTIAPKFVACAKTATLFRHAAGGPRDGISIVLDSGHGMHKRLEAICVSDLEREERRARRGAARVPMPRLESSAVRDLERDSGLFVPVHHQHPCVTAGEHSYASGDLLAGGFFIEKTGAGGQIKLRVIVDGRAGNCAFDTTRFAFPLFSVEELLDCVSGLSKHGTWYAVNEDLRHWFHQIGLPPRLQPFYTLQTDDRTLHACRSVPMGSSFGPAVAQAHTLGMLTATRAQLRVAEAGNPGAWRVALKREYDHELYVNWDVVSVADRMPPWLPLRGGGGIFVILDNILVATPHEHIAAFWRKRIFEQSQFFGCKLKCANAAEEVTELDEMSWHVMTAASGTFEFLGVEWTHGARRLKANNDPAEVEGVGGDQCWRGTHRELASYMGKILWHHRVSDVVMYTDALQQFRKIYLHMAPPFDDGWDARLSLSPELTAALQQQWRLRHANAWTVAVARPKLGLDLVPACAAVDASSTLALIGVVCLAPRQEPPYVVEPPLRHRHSQIAVAELQAILEGVNALKRAHAAGTPLGYIIASDNTNAISWVQKRCAPSQVANAILAKLFDVVGCDGRVHVVYVPSAENAADCPSRGEDIATSATGIDRLNATIRRLTDTMRLLMAASPMQPERRPSDAAASGPAPSAPRA